MKTAKQQRMSVSDYVGSILFPYSYQWERKKYVKYVFLGLFVFMLIAGLVGWSFIRSQRGQNSLNPQPQIKFQTPSSS
jgi:hypothetical protein